MVSRRVLVLCGVAWFATMAGVGSAVAACPGQYPDGSFNGVSSIFQACCHTNGGSAYVGSPYDNGSGPYVHGWGDGLAQDFNGGPASQGCMLLKNGSGTAYLVHGSIWAKYVSLGGVNSVILGWPTSDERDSYPSAATGATARNNGFEWGSINFHASGDHAGECYEVHGAIFTKYRAMGYSSSPLGLPISDERDSYVSAVTGATARNNGFEGGSINYHSSGAHVGECYEVHGAIFAKYRALGYSSSPLGLPISDERDSYVSAVTGATARNNGFEGGSINYHSSGAHAGESYEAHGAIFAKYRDIGYSSSPLGLPISDERDSYPSAVTGATARNNGFEGGSINYHSSGAHAGECYEVHGAIFAKYRDIGYSSSPLGLPISDERDSYVSAVTGATARNNGFEGGSINCHTSGAHASECYEVHGAIFTKYRAMGYSSSPLGLPTSDEFDAASSPYGSYGRVSRFEGGSMYWNAVTDSTHPVYGTINAQYEARQGTGGTLGFPVSDPYGWGDTVRQDFEGGYLLKSGLVITGLTLVPGTLSPGTDVTARLDVAGATSAVLRISGLWCDQPPITMSWNGSAWVATISGSLAAWAQGDSLQVTAFAYDSTGAAAVAVQQLAVDNGSPPVTDSGDPNAIWLDEGEGCGILTGSATVLSVGPPFSARLSMTTVVTSLFGEDGPMVLWPAVTSHCTSGVSLAPSTEWGLDGVFAEYGRCTPSGGPAYEATFASVDDTATFIASMDAEAFALSVWDAVASAASTIDPLLPNISPSSTLQTVDAFAELTPVTKAWEHIASCTDAGDVPWAVAQAASDLSQIATNGSEREMLRRAIEKLGQIERNDPNYQFTISNWFQVVGQVFSAYRLAKILRDWWVWAIVTWDNGDPSLTYHVYRTASGSLAVRASGPLAALKTTVRTAGMEVAYDAAAVADGAAYSFAVSNTGATPLWEFRVDFAASALPPVAVTAPSGWQAETVWSEASRYIRWYTQGPGGWGAGDFGASAIAPHATLAGFEMTLPQRLEQSALSAMDTDLRLDAGLLSMVPGIMAAPADFASAAGESTALAAYADRAGTVSVAIYRDGQPYRELGAPESRPAGEFVVPWDGRNADEVVAAAGDYEARMTIAYPDGSMETRSVPLLLTFSDVPYDFWAHDQVYSLLHSGIANGYAGGVYQPGLPVTRDQMAAYISRALAGGDGAVGAGPSSASFPDVPTDHWAFRYVEYAKANNIVQGYPDGYHPAEEVTRDQMATYIARAIVDPAGDEGLSGYAAPGTPSFADVPTDQWAYRYIEYCYEQGIVQGYWDGYHPDAVVTRDQMAVYIARAFHPARSVEVRARVQGPPEGGLATGMQLEISVSGDPSAVVCSTPVALDGSGQGSVNISVPYGTYDVWGKAPTHLARRLTGWEYAADGVAVLDFGRLLAGDLVDDNVVDQADADYLTARFLTDDPTADINGDGIVNGLDFSILNSNWGQVGDE